MPSRGVSPAFPTSISSLLAGPAAGEAEERAPANPPGAIRLKPGAVLNEKAPQAAQRACMKMMNAPLSLATRLRRSWDINMTVYTPGMTALLFPDDIQPQTFQSHPQRGVDNPDDSLNHSLHH